jgi:quercetin dioxygenase-like cupin family protein
MKMNPFAFGITDWATVEPTEHKGETGKATWRTRHFGDEQNPIRVRMVEYTPGYLADHWCKKGHILFCLEGELETTLEDGRKFVLKPGMSYQVGDNAEAHQSYTKVGARLFVVD